MGWRSARPVGDLLGLRPNRDTVLPAFGGQCRSLIPIARAKLYAHKLAFRQTCRQPLALRPRDAVLLALGSQCRYFLIHKSKKMDFIAQIRKIRLFKQVFELARKTLALRCVLLVQRGGKCF